MRKVMRIRSNRSRTHRVNHRRRGTPRIGRFNRKTPAFIGGMARIFDFTGSMNRRRYRGYGFEADAAALRSDWTAVCKDIRSAMGQFEIQEADRTKVHC